MTSRLSKEQFLIKISGVDVSPDTVRASDLAEFLVHFEKAVLETVLARKDITPEVAEHELIISLVAIEQGSDALTFVLTGEAMSGVSLLSQAHLSHDYSGISPKAQDALHRISTQASKNSWNVEFVKDERHNIQETIISEDDPVPPPNIVTAQGDTTIYGRLMRVGGVSPRAMLAMPDGSYLYIDLTETMAVTLASKERLYQDVGIEGTATWRVDTWELMHFKAKRITDYQPHKNNLVRSFESLAEVAGDRWKDIDIEQFIAEMRGRANS
jgi:hypothetical protein